MMQMQRDETIFSVEASDVYSYQNKTGLLNDGCSPT